MATDKIITQTFPVSDRSCASCAVRVDKTLNNQTGVVKASVNYATASATVEYNSEQTTVEKLKAAVQYAGYDLLIVILTMILRTKRKRHIPRNFKN